MRRLGVVVGDPATELSQDRLGIPQLGAVHVVALERPDERLGEAVAFRAVRRRRDRYQAKLVRIEHRRGRGVLRTYAENLYRPLTVLLVTDSAAAPRYVMPRELVEYARELGCAQIEDLFAIDGMIGPPYAYGYVRGSAEDSAVFWCEKRKAGKRQFPLAVKGKIEGGPFACPRLIPYLNRPGGLDIYREPTDSLEEFEYLDAPRREGPRG